MAQHSPHPWVPWFDYDEDGFICAAGVDSANRKAGICEVLCENVTHENKEQWNALIIADTNMLAAAPELLEALKEVVAIADRKTDEFDKARAVIAKAKGAKP